MTQTLSISEALYERLRHRAQQARQTPDELAEELLYQTLKVEEGAWQQEWDSLISRVHARTAAFSAQEIEADITAAAAEVRKARHASRAN